MNQYRLIFEKPRHTTIESRTVPQPDENELLVANRLSAISAGTEMLIFGGHFPEQMAVDTKIASLKGVFQYPLAYGYSSVGEVVAAGNPDNAEWIGRRVFAFHPHASHFTAAPGALLPLPDDISIDDAVFLANMETAVNLIMDGRPLVGERVAVLGLGTIGLLVTALLSRFPLDAVMGIDFHRIRRDAAADLGATDLFSGQEADLAFKPVSMAGESDSDGRADLIYEVSGNPEALNVALALAGFHTRLVIGSWYGTKSTAIELGGPFHRNRISVTSSQVSTIAPELSARWTSQRRLQTAWAMLAQCRPGRLISHRFQIQEAQEAYELIARAPHETLQVVLTYT
jgi:2-desacetyl-2-hydroxyethyl bacteriochlorophyllide A dehydrogenase